MSIDREMRKAEIIRLIKKLAEQDGTPPGQGRFQTVTGIKIHEWRGKLWKGWADALSDAGFAANSFNSLIPAVELLAPVAELARRVGAFPKSSDLLFESANNPAFPNGLDAESDEVAPALGYVYMIRYGKDYKIGRTSSVSRRSRQVQLELPDTTDLIHAILTDDPVGVEAYWHRRFEQRRGSGEWFKLSKQEVAVFRKWAKIA